MSGGRTSGINGVPVIGQQRQAIENAIRQKLSEITNAIYVHTASAYMTTLGEYGKIDPDRLKQLANEARFASQFPLQAWGIGVQIEKDAPAEADEG